MSQGSKATSLGRHVKVPLKDFRGTIYGDLSVFGKDHEFCGTRHKLMNDMSFIDGHRVRVVSLKQMVYWRVPVGTELDITDVGQARRRVVTR